MYDIQTKQRCNNEHFISMLKMYISSEDLKKQDHPKSCLDYIEYRKYYGQNMCCCTYNIAHK